MVALIPARVGSKRIPGKNTKLLAGLPLIAYTIAAAQQSGVFERICIATDDPDVLSIAMGARSVGDDTLWNHWRTPVPDDQPDLVWVQDALNVLANRPEAFAILRPTSPFRSAKSIRAAWAGLKSARWADSTRAITPWIGPHPAKMWYPQGKRIDRIRPVWDGRHEDGTPWHSSPSQTLKPVYAQTAGLEIGWTARTIGKGSIAGERVLPFILTGPEALDINTPEDWERAEQIAAAHPELLPRIEAHAS